MKKPKDNGMHEHESLEFFKRIVPRNPHDWEGCVVLYSTWNGVFYQIAFGTGGNLSDEDLDHGFNDYIIVTQHIPNEEGFSLGDVLTKIKNTGSADDVLGIRENDSAMWTLKHRDWGNGDIRRFIMGALDFVYGVPKSALDGIYKDLIYVGADYDTWVPKKTARKGAKGGK